MMWREFADWLLRPTFEDDVDKTGMARLLNTFLLMSLGAVIFYAGGTRVVGTPPSAGVLVALGLYCLVGLASMLLLRWGYVRAVGVMVTLTIWGLCSALTLRFGGIHDEIVPGYFVAIAAAGLILGGRGLLVFTLMSGAVLALAYYRETAGILSPEISLPSEAEDLVVVLVLLGLLGFFVRYAIGRIRAATGALQEKAAALQEADVALEASRVELAAEQARLTRRLQASMAVSQAATASTEDIEQLLPRVAEAIAREFGFYHAAIFWVNLAEGTVEVRAAASAEGPQTLARGYRLRIGEGVAGNVARDGQFRLVPDVSSDPEFAYNADLARTRSELAVPILELDRVIGVLDVQSSARGAFSEEDAAVLQSLAHQLAMAIRNARLIEDGQRDLATAERTYRDLTGEDWRRLIESEGGIGFVSTSQGTALVDASQIEQALARTTGTDVAMRGETIRVPVELAGRVVAEVEAHLPADRAGWTQDQVSMLETLSAQLSTALERARLHRETQRRAVRERVLREISDEMGRASDLRSLLQITAESLSRSLGGSQAYVKLATPEDASPEGTSISDSDTRG